jgi:hypothetical protein
VDGLRWQSAIGRRSRPATSRRVNIIAANLKASVIERILTHLGLHAHAPPRARALGQMPLQAA